MSAQTVFRRYEIKYILTPDQKAAVLAAMAPYMQLDRYGETTIRNLYFDTDDYRLIRRSIEKPVYKEKLRIRSYRRIEPDEGAFVEIKKKFKKVVYKRRLVMPERDALAWLAGAQVDIPPDASPQIAEEIAYFRDYYATLHPVLFLSYRREAYTPRAGVDIGCVGDFRVTFDREILARTDHLSLGAEPGGTLLLDPALSLMEIKTAGGLPLWMVELLTREQISKISFSKYGTAYATMGLWTPPHADNFNPNKGDYIHA
ncbi:MAG: polyphosphate polymerase domain-containing protein [Clostridia bacterium]|nr:polyphosphate polymerase domain-containing protein [Clostridia bacterium]MBR7136448.1 polyphosphate polymerase domain-containing protein [Clostridia bacterium]